MSREVVLMFFPVTFGAVRDHLPSLFRRLFPDWVLEQCPMTSMDLKLLRGTRVTLFWPASAVMIVLGLVLGWVAGAHLLTRAMHKAETRRGLFIWSFAFLCYGFMCLGGVFFHCFHVVPVFHLLDAAATGLSSMSIIAGFAAFAGLLDDRTPTQRLAVLLAYLAVAVADILSPPLFQEQLYLLPVLLAAAVGFVYICKCGAAAARAGVPAAQQAAFKAARGWLCLGAFGVAIGSGCLPLDPWLCMHMGAEFSVLFWFFLGCNLAMWAAYGFVLTVCDHKLHFTDVKRQ